MGSAPRLGQHLEIHATLADERQLVARGSEVIRHRDESTRVQRVDGILTRMTYDMRPDLTDTYPFIGWGTDDERRVPVRIHVQNQWGGTVALEMTSYAMR